MCETSVWILRDLGQIICYKEADPKGLVSFMFVQREHVLISVRFSTLLTGKFICNYLYLNWLSYKSLAKRSFRKVVLTDSCRGFNLATLSSSVSYRECVRNNACQEGRKSWLSLIVFRKFCAFPRHMSMHVCLWQNPVLEYLLCHAW